MVHAGLTAQEVARLGWEKYEANIRALVETEENIGKMVIINVETGEYAVDPMGIEASDYLLAKNPAAVLYGIRIGYNVAYSLGGVMERVTL